MTEMLAKADHALLAMTSKAVAAACRSTGLSFPFLLALWRGLFSLTAFLVAAAVVAAAITPLSLAAMVVAVLIAEAFCRDAARLWNDSRRDWTKAMYDRYAAICLAKRERLFAMRWTNLFILACLVFITSAATFSAAPDGFTIWLSVNLVFSGIVNIGGLIEVCEPPLPDDGDFFFVTSPSVA